jgi:hypothetical protein
VLGFFVWIPCQPPVAAPPPSPQPPPWGRKLEGEYVATGTTGSGCDTYLDCCFFAEGPLKFLCDKSAKCKCVEGGACFTHACGTDGCCRAQSGAALDRLRSWWEGEDV